VERNRLIDNTRGIGFGLGQSGEWRTYPDNPCGGVTNVGHYGGIIRNNFILQKSEALYASESGFDSGISLDQVCGAKIVHNTVFSTDTAFSSIEWRYANTNVEITNNLVSHSLMKRDNGNAVLKGNLENALSAWFSDVSNGNLHLIESATNAIDKGVTVEDNLCEEDIDGNARDANPDIGADEWCAIQPGDLDGNCLVTLRDAVLALQITAGRMLSEVSIDGDAVKDEKIGLSDANYILKKLSE